MGPTISLITVVANEIKTSRFSRAAGAKAQRAGGRGGSEGEREKEKERLNALNHISADKKNRGKFGPRSGMK